jgi:Hint domain
LRPGYCAGTLIRTPPGEIPVEQLRIGDEVFTGSDVPRAIKWIGRRCVGGAPEQHPVLIRAGALGERTPARDLCLAPGQAVFIHQKLFPCKLLLNGSSIDRFVETRFTDYFAIELDDHDIIFAEGARSETYVDCDNRELLQNTSEFKRLYPGDITPG